MKNVFIILLSFFTTVCVAQQQDVPTLIENAKAFLKQRDYSNAILVLNRALQMESGNYEATKQLAFAYYLQGDNTRAMKTVEPLLDRRDVDVSAFQVAAMILKAQEDFKEAEQLYKRGLKKFPNSGVMYNEYGEMLFAKQDYSAIHQWEKGIEVDPNYSGNYYNAARYYYFTTEKLWGLIYGEIFINLESYSRRTIEIQTILLDGYRKLFTEADVLKGQNAKNTFETNILTLLNKNSVDVAMGLTAETLTMIRTKFLLEWYEKYASKYPFRLFDYQQQLLKEGMFDSYNQWLFGSVQNLTAFQNWTQTHNESYKTFTGFRQGRVFKVPAGQYYQMTAVK